MQIIVIAGSGIGGMDTIATMVVPLVNEGRVRRLGSRIVEQVMGSGTSARISGLIGAGNQVTSIHQPASTSRSGYRSYVENKDGSCQAHGSVGSGRRLTYGAVLTR